MNYEKIVNVINQGELVILPTDTIYGIMGDALNKEAIEKVYIAKNRDKTKKLILLVDSIDMIKKYTKGLNELEQLLYENYSKYPLTIEMKKGSLLPKEYNSTVDFVGVRIPCNEDLIRIIKMLKRPIFSTSANISGSVPITDIYSIPEELKEHISYIYDGGVINNLASSIVKVDNDRIIVIREGIASKKIREDFNL